jgi:hypothetical protein
MGKFIKYGSFKSFVKSINENEDTYYTEDDLGYDPFEITAKIERAILWINVSEVGRDYADALAHVDVYGSDQINPKTMCTDGTRIIFHPEFVASQTDEAIRFVLLHEILHCIGDHMTRRQNRNPLIWNYACDYAINPTLNGENGIDWPKNKDGSRMGLFEEKYEGMRAEDIYEIIKDKPLPKDEENLGGVVDHGTDLPDPDPGLEVRMTEYDEDEDTPGGSGEDDEEDGESGEGSGSGEEGDEGEDGESGESGEGGESPETVYKVYQAQVGDLIKSKDGRYGKITSINSDGTHDIAEMTEDEVRKERAASSGKSGLSDLADVNEI